MNSYEWYTAIKQIDRSLSISKLEIDFCGFCLYPFLMNALIPVGKLEIILWRSCSGYSYSEIQRAFRLFYRHDRHTMGVDHGCLQAGMAKQRLDGADIVIGLQKVGSEGVTKSVGGYLLG